MTNQNKKRLSILGDRYTEDFFSDTDGILGRELNETGILVLPNFVSDKALSELKQEAANLKSKEYRRESVYNLYVMPEDNTMDPDSPRNRKFRTTKGVVTADQIPENSVLKKIYNADLFRQFICKLQQLKAIFPYADTLSSININYYDTSDNLEWHFDNADFAITLLIKKCTKGGVYEYFPNSRYTPAGKENYEAIRTMLDGKIQPQTATMDEGSLMIFRGNQSLHRVTKIEAGERVLVTLNYNLKPGVPLSEKSRLTFFGRTK